MMFTIDIGKKVTGPYFLKKKFYKKFWGKTPLSFVFCPYLKNGSNDFSETLHDIYNRYQKENQRAGFKKKIIRNFGKNLHSLIFFAHIPKWALKIFMKVCIMFTIDIRKKVTGPHFSKKNSTRILLCFLPISQKTAKTTFLKLRMMFTIDIKEKHSGPDFSKKYIRSLGNTPIFYVFAHISKRAMKIFLKL